MSKKAKQRRKKQRKRNKLKRSNIDMDTGKGSEASNKDEIKERRGEINQMKQVKLQRETEIEKKMDAETVKQIFGEIKNGC